MKFGPMKFGEVPIAEAEGGLLVHRQRLDGRTLAKGHLLTEADIDALAQSGVRHVTIARLGPEDLGEDEAAAAVAAAIAGPGLRVTAAFTGRVNLYAEHAGVALIDRARLDALNHIDEAITVATLAPFTVVTPRQMVATIKIIPFAVPRAAVERARALAAAATSPIAVATFQPRKVALIQTVLADTKPNVLAKTVATIRDRVERLGSHMSVTTTCGHRVADLTAAIAAIRPHAPDLLLILGASAIADRRDVIPTAIEASGGRVEHFGMPVDPGNLLLLAANGDGKPILGLPGCARSPKLNGFDWVLERLLANIPVCGADIMGLGVGGLLAEIPSRPQPRAGAKTEQTPALPRAPRIAAIILAAGRSTRMGGVNKLLADLDGAPMVARISDQVLASEAGPVITVVGHQGERVASALAKRSKSERSITIVDNPDYANGLSTSLKAGLAALPADIDGVLICLGDMPGVEAAALNRLIAAFNPDEGRAICVPTYDGKRGNPVLWPRALFPEMQTITGDVGARHLIGVHAELVAEVAMSADGVLVDLDIPAALNAWRMARAPASD